MNSSEQKLSLVAITELVETSLVGLVYIVTLFVNTMSDQPGRLIAMFLLCGVATSMKVILVLARSRRAQ